MLVLILDPYLIYLHQDADEVHEAANAEFLRILEDIVKNKMKVPVTYEDGDQTLVRGEKERKFLECKWNLGLDYQPVHLVFNHFSPLLVQCFLGNYSKFMSLIEGLSQEELTIELKKRETLLQVSSLFHPITGSYFLVPGSKYLVKAKEKYGEIELMHIKIFKKLLELGADVNAHDFAGYSPLHKCSSSPRGLFSHYEMAKLLIEKGADVNSINRFGETPIFVALSKKKLDFVHLLLENGANPYLKDILGFCAYDYAHIPEVKKILKKSKKISKKSDKRNVATEHEELKKCTLCKKPCKLNCNGCFLEWYCSADCQKSDWRNHKEMCKMRKADYYKVELLEGTLSSLTLDTSSYPRSANFNSIVKVQLHDDTNNSMMVYNKDRTINGIFAVNTNIGAKIFSIVITDTERQIGYFWAMEKKGDTKRNIYINPTHLFNEKW